MSLEAAVAANTEALNKLCALLAAGASIPAAPPKAEAPKAPPAKDPNSQAPAAGRASSDQVQAIPYTAVGEAIVAVGKAFPGLPGREKVLEVLGKFQRKDKPGSPCENGKHLKETDYADALKALSALVTK